MFTYSTYSTTYRGLGEIDDADGHRVWLHRLPLVVDVPVKGEKESDRQSWLFSLELVRATWPSRPLAHTHTCRAPPLYIYKETTKARLARLVALNMT